MGALAGKGYALVICKQGTQHDEYKKHGETLPPTNAIKREAMTMVRNFIDSSYCVVKVLSLPILLPPALVATIRKW